MFARRLIHEDETVCEYKGEIISEAEVARRYPEDMEGLNHTFVFGVGHDHNIDGGAKGNIARWINHSCAPNCDTYEKNKRIYVRAVRDIRPGEELFYDYAIEAGERLTKAVKARWPCWCGAKMPQAPMNRLHFAKTKEEEGLSAAWVRVRDSRAPPGQPVSDLYRYEGIPPLMLPCIGPLQKSFCNGF